MEHICPICQWSEESVDWAAHHMERHHPAEWGAYMGAQEDAQDSVVVDVEEIELWPSSP